MQLALLADRIFIFEKQSVWAFSISDLSILQSVREMEPMGLTPFFFLFNKGKKKEDL